MWGMGTSARSRTLPHWPARAAILAAFLGLTLLGCATSSTKPGTATDTVTPDAVMRLGDRTRESGDLANAAGLYARAAEMQPNDIKPLLALGEVLGQMHSPQQAAQAYQAALKIDPKNVMALRGLANAELEFEDPAAAVQNLQTAETIQPDWRNRNSLGVAYDMQGNHAAAQAAYRSGLALAPDNLQLTNNLGLSLALSGDFTQGLPLLEKSARDPAATPRMRQNLALAYGLSGDDKKAAEVAKIDLDAAGVQENLGYYEFLRLLQDRNSIATSLGAHQAEMAN